MNVVVTMSLTSLLLAASATDEVRRENEALSTELEAAQREHKKLRQVVEQLSRDYDEAKELDPLRRYQRLKVRHNSELGISSFWIFHVFQFRPVP